jgi:hypothetical protein
MGTKAAIFLPFLISCTRAHLRMAELGCLASMPLKNSSKQNKQQHMHTYCQNASCRKCQVWSRGGLGQRM